MKARVKATGEIVNVKPCKPVRINGFLYPSYEYEYGRKYPYKALEENPQSQDTFDYWEKLKHQYAGMAMQGLLSNPIITERELATRKGIVEDAERLAHALVEKMKEERK